VNIAYIVECFETFIVDEVLALRREGVQVTVLNAFRPRPEEDPVKEEMRRTSVYFQPRYRGVTAANVRLFVRRPIVYVGVLALLLRNREAVRMLILGAYYAALVQRDRIDHVHATFGTRTATLAHVIARLAGVPFSFTTHAYDIFKPNPTLAWKTRCAAFVRTISEFNRRFIADTYRDADHSKIVVTYLGVDVDAFRPVPPSERRAPRIVTVGRLTDTKGHSTLIAACDRLRQAGFAFACRIVGGGETHEALAADVATRGLNAVVHLMGPLSHDAVRHVLGDSDVFVLACRQAEDSADQDGIPVALMEAMAMGLCVISTSISGVPELIDDGVSGLLVPPDDEFALSAAVERALGDAALRRQLGAGARQRIEDRFDLTANVRRLVALFERGTPARSRVSQTLTETAVSPARTN
jgi:colanic acid/amylovoran biosynthesis glycosyltransferase